MIEGILQQIGEQLNITSLTLATTLALIVAWLIREIVRMQGDKELESHKASLAKMERLAVELGKQRGQGYGKIWELTGSLNLFGKPTEVNAGILSNTLKIWYFEHGWVLTQPAKELYFLVQEVLCVVVELEKPGFERPADNVLYLDKERRPLQVLKDIRIELLNCEEGRLEQYVSEWKLQLGNEKEIDNQKNWVLLQLLLSNFRTQIINDLNPHHESESETTG